MKTDKLFSEYFQLVPEALFELLQIQPPCAYRFTSPVLKASERRLDGLLEPVEPGYPHYFLELQGYLDAVIYWRVVQQVGQFHAQNPELNGSDWQALVLFLDSSYDPSTATLGPLAYSAEKWLITGVLSDLLGQLAHPSPLLNVLRPLVDDESTIEQRANSWLTELNALTTVELPTRVRLGELLANFVVQRLVHKSRKEIDVMLNLLPLEETVAGKELIEMGIERGIERGIEQGEALILSRQIARKFSVSREQLLERLLPLPQRDLEDLDDYLLRAESMVQIDSWLDSRLSLRQALREESAESEKSNGKSH